MSMGANVLMLPIIIFFLDSEMLGLWYVFASIGGIALLFDFGFGVTFARNITYCWSGAQTLKKEEVVFTENQIPNFLLIKQVLVSCKMIFFVLAGVALLLLLTIGTAYIYYITKGVEGNEHIIAWIIYAFSVFLNLYYGYYASFLRGVGAVDKANKNTVISRILHILFTIGFLMAGFGIIGVCIANLVYGTAFRLLGKHSFYSYKDIGLRLKDVQKKVTFVEALPLFFVVWHNAWREGLISLSNYLSSQACTIICSLYMTLSQTGVYAIGVQIASAIAAVSSALYLASQPQLQAAYISRNEPKVRQTMSLIVTSLILLFVLGVVFSLFAFIPILQYVKHDSEVSIPVLLSLCFYYLLVNFRDVFVSYFSSTNRIPYLYSFLISALFCVLLAVLFIGYFGWGIWGLIIAQIISQATFNVWYWPMISLKEMKIGIIELFLSGLIYVYQKGLSVVKPRQLLQ